MKGKKFLAVAVLLGISRLVNADGISIGYSPVPLQREFVSTDAQTGDEKQNETAYSPATFQILYTVEKKARDTINLTLQTGVGLPIGSATFANTNEVTNVPAVYEKGNGKAPGSHEGDSEEISVFTVPILIGAKYIMPMGDNALTIGVSAGGILIGSRMIVTDVDWAGVPGAQTKATTTVDYASVMTPAFAGFATIGYNIKMGEGESIGIAVPLGIIGEVRMDQEMTNEGTMPAAPPTLLKTQDNGWKAGGFAYGVQIGWNKSF